MQPVSQKFQTAIESLRSKPLSRVKVYDTTKTVPSKGLNVIFYKLSDNDDISTGYWFNNSALEVYPSAGAAIEERTCLAFDWGIGGSPAAISKPDLYAVRWYGYFYARFSGVYTFFIDTPKHSRARIFFDYAYLTLKDPDNDSAVDNWTNTSVAEGTKKELYAETGSLVAGNWYYIAIEFWQPTLKVPPSVPTYICAKYREPNTTTVFNTFPEWQFSDDFNGYTGEADLWDNWHSWDGVGPIQFSGSLMQVGDSGGNDQRILSPKHDLKLERDYLYRISARIYQVDGSGAYCSIGIMGINRESYESLGTTLVNKNGANLYTDQHYFAALNQEPNTGWTIYSGYFQGVAASGNGGECTDPESPGTIHEGANYFRPILVFNSPDMPGIYIIDWVKVEIVARRRNVTNIKSDFQFKKVLSAGVVNTTPCFLPGVTLENVISIEGGKAIGEVDEYTIEIPVGGV